MVIVLGIAAIALVIDVFSVLGNSSNESAVKKARRRSSLPDGGW